MPLKCCVPDCGWLQTDSDKRSLFKMPVDSTLAKRLLSQLGFEEGFAVTDRFRMCDKHFSNDSFKPLGKGRTLVKNPTVVEFGKQLGPLVVGKTSSNVKRGSHAKLSTSSKLRNTANYVGGWIEVSNSRKLSPSGSVDRIKGFEDFIEGTSSDYDHETWRKNWNVYNQPDGVCFYRLTRDEHFTNVTMSFKILVNTDMRVFVFNCDYEGDSSEFNWILSSAKLELWSQFYNLMDYYQNEPDIKLKANPCRLIKQALETLNKIGGSQMVLDLLDPITLQLALVAEKFDPFSGELLIIDEVKVKDEPNFEEFEGKFVTQEEAIVELNVDVTVKTEEPEVEPIDFIKITASKKEKKTKAKPIDDQIFNCEFCGKLFKTISQLSTHFYNTHDGPVYCDICGAKLTVKKSLVTHMIKHQQHKLATCQHCGDRMRPDNLRRHIRVRHEGYKPFPCSICGKFFSNRTSMREHEMIHMDKETGLRLFGTANHEGSYKCSRCGKRFFRGGRVLGDHIAKCDGTRVEKRRAYSYPCLDCGKKYYSKVTCALHMAEAHRRHIDNIEKFCFVCKKEVDEEPLTHSKSHNCTFKCPQCGKGFVSQKKLDNHLKQHTNGPERPFSCDFCSSSFRTKNHLTSHLSIVHTTKDEKQFACSICSKRFAFQYTLRNHLQQSHSSVKKFGCNYCDQKFKTLSRRKDHCIQVHQEKKVYPCQDCDVRLETLNKLKNHQQNEHGKSINVQKYHDG